MFKVVVLFLFSTVCYADIPVGRPRPPQVLCADIPQQMFKCMGNPVILTHSLKCKKSQNICEIFTCSIREMGWLMADGNIDKQKVSQYLDNYAKDHSSWSQAVAQAKATCLGDLPAQGIYLNCPAYDLMMCTMSAFIKNVNPSNWRSDVSCAYARDFARACPICPDECFRNAIPEGSCNACRTLPRTP